MKEFNNAVACEELRNKIDEVIRKYMKKYPVPYEVVIEPSRSRDILNCTVIFPVDTLPSGPECQCSHNERCSKCTNR